MFEVSFDQKHPHRRRRSVMAIGCFLLVSATTAPAQPGQNTQPWSGESVDRGTMAVIMHQVDSGANTSSSSVNAGTTLVCGGGGGTSSATANSSCIIINNGSAQLNTGQTSAGGQSAQSSTSGITTSDPNSISNALSALVPGH